MTSLPEMDTFERLIESHSSLLQTRVVRTVQCGDVRYPIYAASLGSSDPQVPAVGFFGGVHGLERIGTQVLLAFLQTLLERVRWDAVLQEQLSAIRLVFMPLINPIGMLRGTRSNASGVDLMRNAPVDCDQAVPFLLGGQRFSAHLPWYRGSAVMEAESQALCELVEQEFLGRPFSIALDCHSGFGLRDRIWFPYAHSRKPVPHLAELFALHMLFKRAYPNHDYVFEPQSRQYLTHGDLWDHLYLSATRCDNHPVFLPLTLELGSWRWIKKRPMQLFSKAGIFNPIASHRLQRVLRRHLVWLEFLTLAARGWQQWLPAGAARLDLQEQALAHWYGVEKT